MVCDVVIAGAGPNGLMLACELRLAGVRPVVLERLPEPTELNRANGLVGQVVRMLDRRGLYQPLAGQSGPPQPTPAFFFGAVPMDLRVLDDNPFYVLPVPQTRIERVLAERAAELGIEVRRGHELTGLSQNADTVTVEVTGPIGRYEISSRYLVGADGAHSTTRKLVGIEFPGATSDDIVLRIAEVAVPEELVDPATGGLNVPGYGYILPMYSRTERGVFVYGRAPSRPDMVATFEWTTGGFDNDATLTLEEVHDSIYRVMGADLPLRSPEGRGSHRLDRSIGVNTRLANRYRDGRVLLVGDAAHVHFVVGGPGLNLGLQDAINLGWKLAAVIHGWAPAGLLDSYDAERRPIGAWVLDWARAQIGVLRGDAKSAALRGIVADLLSTRDGATYAVKKISGVTQRIDLAGDHPLVGRLAPDLWLRDGSRLADHGHGGGFLLLDRTPDGAFAGLAAAWAGRVTSVTDDLKTPTGVLVRPDGVVAWAADSDDIACLEAVLHRWAGEPLSIVSRYRPI